MGDKRPPQSWCITGSRANPSLNRGAVGIEWSLRTSRKVYKKTKIGTIFLHSEVLRYVNLRVIPPPHCSSRWKRRFTAGIEVVKLSPPD
jgi:hypothetical protein